MTDRDTLSIEIEDAEGTSTVVLSGELDLAGVGAMRSALTGVEEATPPRIVIDLRALEFIDSSGIGELLRAVARADEAGVELNIYSGTGRVAEIISMAGLDEALPIVD